MRIEKRLLDIVMGSLLALLALPFILLAAVISTLALRAWPFFVQRRVGLDGRMFTIVKIRTLPVRTFCYAAKTDLAPDAVPPATALLRRTHLDELPQLLLVPLGTMSLVGPRPEMRFLHDRLTSRAANLRTSVRPGCTGLWQISEGSSQLISETPEFDRYYVENLSVRLDLWILWRTIRLIFMGAQPVSLHHIPRWVLPKRTTNHNLEPTVAPPLSTAQEPL